MQYARHGRQLVVETQRIEEYATVTSPYNTYLNPGCRPARLPALASAHRGHAQPAASDYCSSWRPATTDAMSLPAPWQSMNRTCASTAIDRRRTPIRPDRDGAAGHAVRRRELAAVRPVAKIGLIAPLRGCTARQATRPWMRVARRHRGVRAAGVDVLPLASTTPTAPTTPAVPRLRCCSTDHSRGHRPLRLRYDNRRQPRTLCQPCQLARLMLGATVARRRPDGDRLAGRADRRPMHRRGE